MLKIEIKQGEEVLEKITKVLAEKSIKEAAMVSVIGAVDECRVSTMSKKDSKQNIFIEYNEPLELSGTGEIHEGKPHIHAVLGSEGNDAIFGHLHYARVKNWFVHVYVIPF